MAKHSRAERERRSAETLRVKEIEAAWLSSLAPETARAFTSAVQASSPRSPPAGAADAARLGAATAPAGT